jgi:trans-aconitate methyltransferase
MMSPGIYDPGPWEDPEQAAYYEALCDRTPHYSEVARALVDAVPFPADAQVADLGCGTGMLTAHILARLGEQGTVVGVDPAPRMVAAAARRIEDPRASFERGNAHGLRDAMPVGPGFSAILCSAAFWLEQSPETALRVIRGCLRRSGRLGLSLPAELLGEVEHMLEPAAVAVAQAIGQARGELGLALPESGSYGLAVSLTSREAFARTLERLGYGEVAFTPFERRWTVGEYFDWMGQPVVLGGMVPQATPDQRAAFARRLGELVDGALPLTSRWLLITAARA